MNSVDEKACQNWILKRSEVFTEIKIDLRCVFGILKQKANDFESQIAYNECRLPSNGSSSKDQKVHFEITKGMILQMCWW
jgi:hypothetical protein